MIKLRVQSQNNISLKVSGFSNSTDADKTIENLNKEIASLNSSINDLNKEIDLLEDSIVDKDEYIADLKSEHLVEIDNINLSYQELINDINSDYLELIEELNQSHNSELEQINKDHLAEIESIELGYTERDNELKVIINEINDLL